MLSWWGSVRIAILRLLLDGLARWTEFFRQQLVSLESERLARESDYGQDAPVPPSQWLDRAQPAPPPHWLERVRKDAPELLRSEGVGLIGPTPIVAESSSRTPGSRQPTQSRIMADRSPRASAKQQIMQRVRKQRASAALTPTPPEETQDASEPLNTYRRAWSLTRRQASAVSTPIPQDQAPGGNEPEPLTIYRSAPAGMASDTPGTPPKQVRQPARNSSRLPGSAVTVRRDYLSRSDLVVHQTPSFPDLPAADDPRRSISSQRETLRIEEGHWPTLPEETPESGENAEALLRDLERRQRLDQEQRGLL